MSLQQNVGSFLSAAEQNAPDLPPALEGIFRLVLDPVLRLTTGPDGEMTLREISIVLGDLLDWLEENHRIVEAADRLYAAALSLQHGPERRSRLEQSIARRTETLQRRLAEFHKVLRSAKPSPRARARQVAW